MTEEEQARYYEIRYSIRLALQSKLSLWTSLSRLAELTSPDEEPTLVDPLVIDDLLDDICTGIDDGGITEDIVNSVYKQLTEPDGA